MNVQTLIASLECFWRKKGCVIIEPYCGEVGAGTFHPATFFQSLSPHPWRTAYVQPSRRPADGRYADNPLRAQFYYQYQVILKPAPENVQELYLESLRSLGIDLTRHDYRFVEDDWASPTLGAWGVGWEVWLDSLEVTQFTYFQQVGGIDVPIVPAEITYGIERIAMFLQGTYDIYKLKWNDELTYGDLHRQSEIEGSHYNFDYADIKRYMYLFSDSEKQAKTLIDADCLYPAYDHVLKMSHAFNVLDARGVISATERPRYIGRIRARAKQCAEFFVARYDNEKKEYKPNN